MPRAASQPPPGSPRTAQGFTPTAAEWRRSLPRGLMYHLVRTEAVVPGYYSHDMRLTQVCNNEVQRGERFEVLTAEHVATRGFRDCCDTCLSRMYGPARKFYDVVLLPEDVPPGRA